jgi:hydroxyacylglutathione hydrolase
MYVQQFFVDGLGCASYMVGCEGEGIAAVVDPERDVEIYLEAAQARGLRITHIIETHLHADHVSGNTDLSARTGADIYVHEAAKVEFAHKALKDGDVLELGAVRIAVRHTPGHTPESITLLVGDSTRGEEPWMALTGDLLFVGDIGRPDLVGAQAARGLAEQLYDSLHNKLLHEHDGLVIYPGHGAGSLCGRSIGSVRSSTLGYERRYNPSLAERDPDEFIKYMTTNLPEQPGNHTRIKAMNRKGPKPLGQVTTRALTIRDSIPYFQRGAALIDTRPKADFIQRHVPGSVHLAADDQLSNRVGFVVPPNVPLVLMVENEAVYREVVLSLARVGYDNVAGFIAEGIEGWEAMGLPITSGDVQDISAAELRKMVESEEALTILDVREPWEFEMGHIPGAVLIPLGQLSVRVGELSTEQRTAVICQSGSRSQSAAALLAQKGFARVYNVIDGMSAWERYPAPVR